MSEDITDRQREYLDALPQPSYQAWGAAVGSSESSAEEAKARLNEYDGISIGKVDGQWRNVANQQSGDDADETLVSDGESDEPDPEPDEQASLPDLDEDEYNAVRALPASLDELNELLEADAHYVLESLRESGIDIGYDPDASKYYIADERSDQIRQKSEVSLTQKTKEAKAALRDEQAILERLPDTTPLTIEGFEPTAGKETMVAAIGDVHFGDVVKDDRGRTVYDREIAHEAVDRFAEKVVMHKQHWTGDFEECQLAILGDIATGTQIYRTQQHDIQDQLAQQIKDGSQALTRLAATLREHFDALKIAAIVGNHGFQDPSAARGSNTDLTCYYWMQDALRREGYDDVEIVLGEHSHHLNVDVRGWRMHLRHGQDTKEHIDETASSKAEWRGWRDKHKYDFGVTAHHHVPSLHYVLNRYPVARVPSPKPGGEFADRIGDPDVSTPAERSEERQLGYCFGVSDDRRMTDSRMTDAG